MKALMRLFFPMCVQPRLLNSCKGCNQHIQTRGFYKILTDITNRPDKDRIKEVGPNRACAEWLLRCGATFKWKGFDRFQTDYHALPSSNFRVLVIEEVEAVEAGITYVGFEHFAGCEHIRRVRFHHCAYVDDECVLATVERLKGSLQQLELSSCDISDTGLRHLTQLQKLAYLFLQDLPEVRNKTKCYTLLQEALPNCSIDYTDVTHSPT